MPKQAFPPRWPCYADMTVRFQLETTIPSGLMDLYKLSKCRLCGTGHSPGCVCAVKLCVEEEDAPLFVCVVA
jgi:hypothetical protein